jgi:hypothetical protein
MGPVRGPTDVGRSLQTLATASAALAGLRRTWEVLDAFTLLADEHGEEADDD